MDSQTRSLVAVIGAGPAGLFAARQLAVHGVHVVILNRDIKHGGLAEYGIFPSKLKMKDGLRRQFGQILDNPLIDYYGNITIGEQGDLTLPDLLNMGFQAVLVTAGAQGTKWLGLPGEELRGVYHAKDIVYHYNQLPPFSEQQFDIGRRVGLVGVGNVMIDVAHWLVRYVKVDEVVAIARRGPAEVKFTRKEMETIARNLDLAALDAEYERVVPAMQAIGQDEEKAKNFILSALPKADEPVSDTRFRFDFLASPVRMVGDKTGHLKAVELEDTTLEGSPDDPHAKRTGTQHILDIDTLIFCIGDRVDEAFGLPVRKNAFVKNPNPQYPVEGLSFEAYDPDLERPIDRVFVAGWSREASSGLVGFARKDGELGAEAVLQYLMKHSSPNGKAQTYSELKDRLAGLGKPLVTKADILKLLEYEKAEAARQGVDEYKCKTNQEMLVAMGLLEPMKK